jgi:hypothetical protein
MDIIARGMAQKNSKDIENLAIGQFPNDSITDDKLKSTGIKKTVDELKENSKLINQDNTNNIKPLYITTMDKTNQPLHPNVVYIADGFNGYKYWMVETPLPKNVPPYSDRYECPHIHCSNDGVEWTVPTGLINPIDNLTLSEIANVDYFSDPHLVIKNGVLECWYRITHSHSTEYPGFTLPTWLLRKTSTDGVTWTTREVMNNFQDVTSGLYNMVRSPSLWWDGTKYIMYFGDKLGTDITPKNIVRAESTDGLIWVNRVNCILNGLQNDKWHMDVSYSNNKYHLILYGYATNDLIYYASVDGINFTSVCEVLKKSIIVGSNFDQGLYRSSLLWNGTYYLLYITAQSEKYSIMLAVGKTVETLKFIDGSYFRKKQFFENGIRMTNNEVMTSNIELSENADSIGYSYDKRRLAFVKDGISQHIGVFVDVPLTPNSDGFVGDFSADINYFYICYSTNSWQRIKKDSVWVTVDPLITNGLLINLNALDFKSAQTTSWIDRSVNVNNATPIITSGSDGIDGLLFNGTTDYFSIPDKISLNPSANFSLSAKFKSSATANLQVLLSKCMSIGGAPGFGLILRTTQPYVRFFMFDTTLKATMFNTPDLRDGLEHTVQCKREGLNFIMFIDGVYVGTETFASLGSTINTTPLLIGADNNNGTRLSYFKGTIYSVNMYNRALTNEEFIQNYNLTL